MENSTWPIVILLTLNGILMAIVGFFIKHVLQQVLNKITLVETALTKLNISFATIVTKQDNHKDKFKDIDKSIERLDIESKSVRERLHSFGNDLHGLTLQTELCKEQRDLGHE